MRWFIALMVSFLPLACGASEDEHKFEPTGQITEFALYDLDNDLVRDLVLCMVEPTLHVGLDRSYELRINQMNSCDLMDFTDSVIFDFGTLSGASVTATDILISGTLPESNGLDVFHHYDQETNTYEIGEALYGSGQYIYIKASRW